MSSGRVQLFNVKCESDHHVLPLFTKPIQIHHIMYYVVSDILFVDIG